MSKKSLQRVNHRNSSSGKIELQLKDYRAVRRIKRKELLVKSLPITAFFVVLGIWLTLPVPLTQLAINDYNNLDYERSRSWLTPILWSSPQPFVAAFDSGTADARLGKFDRAEKELSKALTLARNEFQRCMVLHNLVFTYNSYGAALVTQGKNADSITMTQNANDILNKHKNCFPEVSRNTEQDDGGGGGGGGGGSQSQAEQILSASQQQQLQQKNERGQRQQQEEYLQDILNPNSPKIKPW